MKLTFFLTIAVIFNVSAIGFSQQVSFSGKNVPLDKVFNEIEKQTGYLFFYQESVLLKAKPVTVSARNQSLKLFMDDLLKDQPLTYKIREKNVIITAAPVINALPSSDPIFYVPIIGTLVHAGTGEPLSGASITIKGKATTVATDNSGKFSINANIGDVLIVSYVGFKSKEIKITMSSLGAVLLEPSTAALDEVVISTGYTEVSSKKMTGAASSLSREKYDQRVSVTGNFIESLEGKIPGLVVNTQTGEISIRGVSTFDAVRKPLIVVDGFPTEIDIRSINPNDIVSVNVLKDAAAASIYGARASNGVIIIETKRGKSGKPVFSFRSTLGYQDRPDFGYLHYGDALENAQVQKNYVIAAGQSRTTYTNAKAPASPVQNAVFDFKAGLIDQAGLDSRIQTIGSYDNLKEYEQLFYRRRLATQIDFDVSGGNDKNSYLLGVNYINEEKQYQRSDNTNVLVNFASTHKFTEGIKFDFRSTYNNFKSTSPGSVLGLNNFQPYERLADDNGNPLPMAVGPGRNSYTGILPASNITNMALGLYDQLYYPYRELFVNTNTTKSSAVRFQGRLNAKITKWLSLDLGGVYENQPTAQDRLTSEESFSVRRLLNYKAAKDAITGGAIFTNLPQGDFLTRVNEETSGYTTRGQFNVNYTSPNLRHSITGIVGSEFRKTVTSSYMNTFFGYDGQSLIVKPVNFLTLAAVTAPAFNNIPTLSRPALIYEQYFAETFDDRRFASFYGDGTYVFDERYALSGSFRLDKTNLFGTDPKFRNKPFYSIGANWRITKEDFMANTTWLDDLKLRVAYGVNGNVPVSNNGPFLILNSGLNYYLSPSPQYYDVLSPENQSLRWEKTTNINIGLDYSLFNNRLSGAIDYYNKKSQDVFGQYSADPTGGFNEYSANTASIVNNGLELSLNSINVQKQRFSWQTQVTASFNKNEVTAVKTISSSSTGVPLVTILNIQKGYPIDALFAYDYAGLSNLGVPQIIGGDGNKKTIASSSSGTDEVNLQDLKYMGTTAPKHAIGLNNQFSLGNFDLSFLFMYYGGYVMRVEAPDPMNMSPRVLQGASNYWQKAGDEASTQIPGFPLTNSPGYFDAYARLGYNYASQFVRKADHIRLRDIVVTYNLKGHALSKIGLNHTQLRAQVQNAFKYTFSGNDIDADAINRSTGTRILKQEPFFSMSLYTNF